MTTFEQDLVKIILDKALLGVVAAAFGLYLARLLENYKSKKSYELFIWQQRVDACRTASQVITAHFYSVLSALDALTAAAEKGSMSMEDENAKVLLEHAKDYPRMRTKLVSPGPLLVPRAAEAMLEYLNEAGRVAQVVRGDLSEGIPTENELSHAHSKFQVECSEVMSAGPYQ